MRHVGKNSTRGCHVIAKGTMYNSGGLIRARNHRRRDPIRDGSLTDPGAAFWKFVRSALLVSTAGTREEDNIPASLSKTIRISSCSIGYSGISKHRKSEAGSSSVLGSANLASAKRIQNFPDRLKLSIVSVPLRTKFMHLPWLKSLKNATS